MEPLTFNPVVPVQIIGLTALILVALAALAAWRTRHSWSRWANLSALGLRAIVLVCAFILALRPQWVARDATQRSPTLALLIDDTQSMRLPQDQQNPHSISRSAVGQKYLEQLHKAAATQGWAIQAFDAGKSLVPRHPGDATFRASASESLLGDRLLDVLRQFSRSENGMPGAVILFSDGCVTKGQPLSAASNELGKMAISLHAWQLGTRRTPPPDVILSNVTARAESLSQNQSGEDSPSPDPIPRVGQSVLVEGQAWIQVPDLRTKDPYRDADPSSNTPARLHIQGPDPRSKEKEENEPAYQLLSTLDHRIRPQPAWSPIRFRFTPRAPGFYRVRLSLDPLKGETATENNVGYSSITILPPMQRVLYAASRLGHDYRHLKALFSTWDRPVVEVVSDFLKPEPAEDGKKGIWPLQQVLSNLLSDRSFLPGQVTTLVWAEPEPDHLDAATQKSLHAALCSGELALIWVLNEPADAFFRRFQNSDLQDTILFKEFDRAAVGEDGAPRFVAATPKARTHPATGWAFKKNPSTMDPWQDLNRTTIWTSLRSPREETDILLQAGTHPLLSVGRAGQGRVALLATGDSWRWLAPDPDQPSTLRTRVLVAELWKNLISWAAGSGRDADTNVRIHLPRTSWDLDEDIRFHVSVRGPQSDLVARLEYRLRPYGFHVREAKDTPWQSLLQYPSPEAPETAKPNSSSERVFEMSGKNPGVKGEWSLEVRVFGKDGKEMGSDGALLVARGSDPEQESFSPDSEGLQAAVRHAGPGGRFLEATEGSMQQLISSLKAQLRPEIQYKERRVSAVNRAALLFLLILALGVDVWLRRDH